MSRGKKEKEYLTAIDIRAGIIRLIEMDGSIGTYRQRGIEKYSPEQLAKLVGLGLLDAMWVRYPSLPGYKKITYEVPDIMGRARGTFPDIESIMKVMKMEDDGAEEQEES